MSDFFGSLMKGFGGLIPQDDPETKIYLAQNTIKELKAEEEAIYAKLGRKLLPMLKDQPEYADTLEELRVNEKKCQEAEAQLGQLKSAAEKAKQEKQALYCPDCGEENPSGTKFCQGCGKKLGQTAVHCPQCGSENKAGTKFCGDCGTKLE